MQDKAAQVHEMRRVAELNARLQRADQAMEAGGWDEAIDILNDGLASDPENETLKTKLAEARKAKREARLQAALRLAESAAQAGKWEAAVASLNEVLANEPDNAEFQKKLAEVRAREHQSRWESARDRRRKVCEKRNGSSRRSRSGRPICRFIPKTANGWMGKPSQSRRNANFSIFMGMQKGQSPRGISTKPFALLKEIIIRDENYKDASRLLTKAIESRRTGTTQKLGKPRKKPSAHPNKFARRAPKLAAKESGSSAVWW